ncbi:MAG: DUF4175 family protein [Gemmatimonadaceae bacterium]
MTAIDRVRRTQRVLGAAAFIQAFTWGISAALVLIAVVGFASLAIPGIRDDIAVYRTAGLVIGLFVTALLLWRRRHVVSTTRVALWIEERVPQLNYSLVTALEQPQGPFRAGMESIVAREEIGRATFGALRRGFVAAVAALLIAGLLLYVSPSGAFGGGRTFSGIGRFGTALPTSTANRLENLRVVVTPPAYTGSRSFTVDDPSSVTALTGSGIGIRGRGAAAGLSASLSGPLRIVDDDGGWSVSLVMPARPAALTLTDRTFERTIVLAPRTDAPPRITLTSPLRDTTLRRPQLVLSLNATATDDIGLAAGHFEYLVTTGAGEVFKSRSITTPIVRFGGASNGALSASLDLASLHLGEGDVLSMRAIVEDGNTVSGPGIATSDTRTIRIARASEYDSLAIDAAAPQPIDSSAISQRMLIVMTEQLVREQPRLTRQELVKRSTDIGDLEERIRKRVHEILTQTEEEAVAETPGETPSIEQMEAPEENTGTKNPDLVTAYNALWQAVRSLQIAEPAPALPPMRVALRALDKARLANRLYLRGMPPRIVVDLNRVRLTGKDKGVSSTRAPRSFADSMRVRLAARFSAVLDLIGKDPSRATTELALLRVDALSSLPDFAAALGEATDAIRAGRDVTLPLLRARRALNGPPQVTPNLSQWSGGGKE